MAVIIRRLGYAQYTTTGSVKASDVVYNNATSGLVAVNAQNAIDELAGKISATFSLSFLITDWTLVSGNYELSILQSTHLKGINPIIQVFENVAGTFEEVLVGLKVDASGNIKLIVNQSPDSRFSGKVQIK